MARRARRRRPQREARRAPRLWVRFRSGRRQAGLGRGPFGAAGARSSPARREPPCRLGRQQLTKPRARALVLAIGIARERRRRGGADHGRRRRGVAAADPGGHRLARLARRAARARRRGRARPGPRLARRPQLAGGAYEDFLRRRLALIRAERPSPRRISRGAGRGFGTLRARRWRPPPPSSRLIKRRRALIRAPTAPSPPREPRRCRT